MPIKQERQYRSMVLSAQPQSDKLIDTDYYVEGYAANYERYKLWDDEDGGVWEQFTRENFEGVDLSDVIMQYNHQGEVFARCKNGSMIVRTDDRGLFIAADLGQTQRGKEVYEMIVKGMVDKMSWGFIPQGMHYDRQSRTITYDGIRKIFDVSAVSIPANDTTDIHARSLIDGAIEQAAQEWRSLAKARLKLKIKTITGGKPL